MFYSARGGGGGKCRADASGVNGRVRSDERRNLSDDTKDGARRVGEIFNSLRGDAERKPGLICCRAITPVQYGIMDV